MGAPAITPKNGGCEATAAAFGEYKTSVTLTDGAKTTASLDALGDRSKTLSVDAFQKECPAGMVSSAGLQPAQPVAARLHADNK